MNERVYDHNNIAALICDQFAVRFPNDPGYVEEKRARLDGVSKFDALLYLNEIDQAGLDLITERVDVDSGQLRAVAQFLRRF